MLTPKNWPLAMMLLALCVPNLPGCASPSRPVPPVLVTSPRLPPPDPRLMTPIPDPASYSERVRASLHRWATTLEASPR